MADPLINRDALIDVIDRAWEYSHITATDSVLAYLREVLTPEVLCVNDLYRRIFGEDQ